MVGKSFANCSVDSSARPPKCLTQRREGAKLRHALFAPLRLCVRILCMNVWNWPIFWDHSLRIAAAAVLGGVLGLERQWKGHWAGLRTHMMVSIGSAVFVIAGWIMEGDRADQV